jgi:hypothetical protein
MTNQYGQPGADPAGTQPTQQLWAGSDAPAATPPPNQPGPAGLPGPAGPGFAGHPLAGLPEPKGKHHRKAVHWTAGLLAAALLAGGGTVAGLRLAGHPPTAASTGQPALAGAAQQGALLNATLSGASAPGALTAGATRTGGAGDAAAAKAHACARASHAARAAHRSGMRGLGRRMGMGAARCRMIRRRVFAFFLLRGVDGQFTIQTKQGIKTLAYERGVIQSVTAGKSITVKASDGTTWTWDLTSTTVVRDLQKKLSDSSLTAGTPVWAGGPVVSGTKDARLIVVRPPQPGSVPPSSASGS